MMALRRTFDSRSMVGTIADCAWDSQSGSIVPDVRPRPGVAGPGVFGSGLFSCSFFARRPRASGTQSGFYPEPGEDPDAQDQVGGDKADGDKDFLHRHESTPCPAPCKCRYRSTVRHLEAAGGSNSADPGPRGLQIRSVPDIFGTWAHRLPGRGWSIRIKTLNALYCSSVQYGIQHG